MPTALPTDQRAAAPRQRYGLLKTLAARRCRCRRRCWRRRRGLGAPPAEALITRLGLRSGLRLASVACIRDKRDGLKVPCKLEIELAAKELTAIELIVRGDTCTAVPVLDEAHVRLVLKRPHALHVAKRTEVREQQLISERHRAPLCDNKQWALILVTVAALLLVNSLS